ncbi:MAG: hypothetical protein AB7G25_02045 [Sphingomonadaceae bacterium]
MRVVKFDIGTYNQTKGTGTPLYSIIEEEVPQIEMIVDDCGAPTIGGRIGYALAYILMVGFVGALFVFL